MNTEKTILSAADLVNLYQEHLVVIDDSHNTTKAIVEVKTPTTSDPIKQETWVGPISVHLNEMDFILLTSILNACRLTIADVALINLGKQPVGLHQILQEYPSTLLISFAVDATQLKVKLPNTLYKVNSLGETHILFSNALSTMQGTGIEAKQEKAKLWTVLKKIFEL
jgi:hypothetical protein